MWTTKNIPDLTGKTAMVTGANTGIGYEMAKALYNAGARVILGARDPEKAAMAIDRIRSENPAGGTIEAGILDLANIASIRIFAEELTRSHARLDILINNAGVMIPPASLTGDGFELQFGVNFIGHFALTGLLLPLLEKSPGARVVHVSSGAATRATGIDFSNLRLEKPYDSWREYDTSKLANVLFAYELNRKAKAAGLQLLSTAVHPGVTRTDLQRHIPGQELEGLFARFDVVMEPWQGALPALYAATDPAVIGGRFYGPDGEQEFSGYPALSSYNTAAMNDEALAQQLWDFAEAKTSIHFDFKR